MADSFVHLHNHTEYSMLDGAQKLKPMFAEVDRQGMPAVAMSDHGNRFGAYEFQQVAKGFGSVKPIIGIEAYVAPSSRRNRRQEFWGPGGQRAVSDDGEGSKDVSGGGRFTHMTMWATKPLTLRSSPNAPASMNSSATYGTWKLNGRRRPSSGSPPRTPPP